MKTKDLIKLLQEEDPSGEGYVRIEGGAIVGAEAKEGYWDGSYSYFENGVYVTSTRDYKVDIRTMDVDDVIWDLDGDMEQIRKKVRVEYTYCDKTKEENFWKHVEEEAKTAKDTTYQIDKEFSEKTLKRYKEGWKIRHLKTDKGKTYLRNWIWVKGMKTEKLCFGEIEVVCELFHPVEKKKYIYYKLNENIN